MRKLSNAIKRDVEKNRLELGIEHVKGINGWVIDYFYQNRNNDIFQKDFEEKFSIRSSTASRMLKTMEQNGFIERVSVENDGRLKKIVLTDKAAENHKKIIKSIEQREEKLRKGLSESELEIFFKVMKKLTENMEANDD